MQIRKAELKDVEAILPQFIAYRAFYKKEALEDQARAFLTKNIEEGQSTIFIATDVQGKVVGFIQLYLRLSSLAMRPYIYLSDLYIDKEYRQQGIARALMAQANHYGIEFGAANSQLETAHTNAVGQSLYESLGYQVDKEFRTYWLALPSKDVGVDKMVVGR